MSLQSGIALQTRRLAEMSPKGFSFSLHIRFAMPLLHNTTFPVGWTELYAKEAYALRDPIVAWGFSEIGSKRWSEIGIPDPFDILGQAKSFSMNYGFAVSYGPMNSRTIASAAREDREFSDGESIAEGDRHAAAAARLNISESALKARLSSARNSLLARTTAEAIQRARDYRLL